MFDSDARECRGMDVPASVLDAWRRCIVLIWSYRSTSNGELTHSASRLGWYHGSIHMDDYVLRILCVEFQISIVNVEYRYVQIISLPLYY